MSKNSYYEVDGDVIRVYTPYCDKVVQECRSIGGKFVNGAWELPVARLKDVQENLGEKVDDMVEVDVPANYCTGSAQLSFGWFVMAGRRSRDGRADIYETMVAGSVPSRGGSVKNPAVAASDDCVFRVWVPRDVAEIDDLVIVTDPRAKAEPDLSLLSLERERLLERLAEIDAILEKAGHPLVAS